MTLIMSIVLSLFLLLTYSLSSKARGDDYYEVTYSSWHELEGLTPPTLPVATASAAIQFAAQNTNLLSSLRIAEEAAKYDGWTVTSERISSNEETMWSVQIQSRGVIPSFKCAQTFRPSGQATSDRAMPESW